MATKLDESLDTAGERLSDATSTIRTEAQDLTQTLVAEATEIADRIAGWISDNDPVGQARHAATDSMESVRDWSASLPAKLAAALPVVTVAAKPKKRTMVAAFAAGAAVAYLFDPTSGADRRAALKKKAMELVARDTAPDSPVTAA